MIRSPTVTRCAPDRSSPMFPRPHGARVPPCLRRPVSASAAGTPGLEHRGSSGRHGQDSRAPTRRNDAGDSAIVARYPNSLSTPIHSGAEEVTLWRPTLHEGGPGFQGPGTGVLAIFAPSRGRRARGTPVATGASPFTPRQTVVGPTTYGGLCTLFSRRLGAQPPSEVSRVSPALQAHFSPR